MLITTCNAKYKSSSAAAATAVTEQSAHLQMSISRSLRISLKSLESLHAFISLLILISFTSSRYRPLPLILLLSSAQFSSFGPTRLKSAEGIALPSSSLESQRCGHPLPPPPNCSQLANNLSYLNIYLISRLITDKHRQMSAEEEEGRN